MLSAVPVIAICQEIYFKTWTHWHWDEVRYHKICWFLSGILYYRSYM